MTCDEKNINLKHPVTIYWEAYGKWKAIFTSYYFGISIIITFLCMNFWLNDASWVDTPLSGLPSLLGFSLGGYAVWLSIGDEKLKKLLSLSTGNNKHSDFIVVNATFIHFIFLQIVSYIYLFILKAKPFSHAVDYYNFSWIHCISILYLIFNFIGFLLFTYSIISMLAAVLAIFQIANWTDILNKNS